MKQKLFNLLPDWLKQFKHSDKIAHAIYGTLCYLLGNVITTQQISLILTCILAVAVEAYDKYRGGKPSTLDILATIAIPVILYFVL
jgi:hypothetical protein